MRLLARDLLNKRTQPFCDSVLTHRTAEEGGLRRTLRKIRTKWSPASQDRPRTYTRTAAAMTQTRSTRRSHNGLVAALQRDGVCLLGLSLSIELDPVPCLCHATGVSSTSYSTMAPTYNPRQADGMPYSSSLPSCGLGV